MQNSQRKLMAVAVLGVIVASALSACADLERIGQAQTPYDGPAHQVTSVYSASTASTGDALASAMNEQRRRDKAK